MRRLPPYILLAVIFVAFAGTLQSFFVQDDFWMLKAIDHEWPNWYMLWGQRGAYIRPVSTYWWPLLNYTLFGLNPPAWHMMMMVVFLSTCYLLYRYLLDVTSSQLGALVGMGVYGLSKIHVWTLSWVAGSCDVLGMFFVVLGLYLHQRKHRGWRMVALVLAFFCKEMFGIALLCLVLISLMSFRRNWGFAFDGTVVGIGCLAVRQYLTSIHPHLSTLAMSDLLRPFAIERAMWIWGVYGWVWYAVLGVSALWLFRKYWSHLVFALLLFTLNGLMFAVIEWPRELQPYYAHFCVLAVAMVSGIVVAEIKNKAIIFLVIALAIPSIWMSVVDNQERIERRACPALHESLYSEIIYNSMRDAVRMGATSVSIEIPNTVISNAIGHGRMMEIYFPDLEVEYTGECGGEMIERIRAKQKMPITEER